MSKGIRFSDGAHWYDKTGKAQHDADLRVARKQLLYPSVTSIDKDSFPNLFLERWKLDQLVIAASENPRQPHESGEQYGNRVYEISMEKATTAAEFGTKIHKALEDWPSAPSPELLPWWIKFDDWAKRNNIIQLHSEKRLLHHGIGVAGTADLIANTKAHRLVVDYKTQDVKIDDKGRKKPAFYDSWVRQLAFYEQAHRIEDSLINPCQCVSLIIDSNEGGEIYEKWWSPEEIQAAYEEFVAGAWLWCRKRGYWPVGEWKLERV